MGERAKILEAIGHWSVASIAVVGLLLMFAFALYRFDVHMTHISTKFTDVLESIDERNAQHTEAVKKLVDLLEEDC